MALEGARFSTPQRPRRAAPQSIGRCEQSRSAGEAQRSDCRPGRQRQRPIGRASGATQFVDTLMNNLTAVSQQISGSSTTTGRNSSLPSTNSTVCWGSGQPQKELQRTLYLLRRYAMSFGEVLGSGPFFKASLVTFSRQFVRHSPTPRSRFGLTPMCCCRHNCRPGCQPGTPALPVPYPAPVRRRPNLLCPKRLPSSRRSALPLRSLCRASRCSLPPPSAARRRPSAAPAGHCRPRALTTSACVVRETANHIRHLHH